MSYPGSQVKKVYQERVIKLCQKPLAYQDEDWEVVIGFSHMVVICDLDKQFWLKSNGQSPARVDLRANIRVIYKLKV